MTHVVARRWWMFGLRALGFIVFAVLLVPRLGSAAKDGVPRALTLAQLFGFLAILSGLATFISAGGRPGFKWMELGPKERGPLRMEGVIGVLSGAIALIFPEMPNWSLRLVVALFAILTGVFMMPSTGEETFNNRKLGRGALYGFCAVLSIAFGVAFAIWAQGSAAVWLFFIYASITGLCFLALTNALWDFRCCFN